MQCAWIRWLASVALVSSMAFGHEAFGKDASHKARVHVVYPGQRLGSIAKRYNVSVEALCRINNIRTASRISPGQKLVIPGKDDLKALANTPHGTVESEQVSPPSTITAPESPTANAGLRADAPRPSAAPPKALRAELVASKPVKPSVHVVQAGQRLGSIAKRYNLGIDSLCQANGISRKSKLRVGQELVLPSTPGTLRESRGVPTAVIPSKPPPVKSAANPTKTVVQTTPNEQASRFAGAAPPSWQTYTKKPWRQGYIDVHGYKERWKGYVIGPKGDVLPQAKQHISRVLSSRRDLGIDKRLIVLIAKASDRFGGRPLRIVSGYRERSYARASRHRLGRAVDFSIPGVPNTALRDYLRTLKNVGVGYYPNSSFVHLDVREGAAYWVDYSRPGQPPIYRARQTTPTGNAASAALDTRSLTAPGRLAADDSADDHDGTPEPSGIAAKGGSSKVNDSKVNDSKVNDDEAPAAPKPAPPAVNTRAAGNPKRPPTEQPPSEGGPGQSGTAPSEEAPDH